MKRVTHNELAQPSARAHLGIIQPSLLVPIVKVPENNSELRLYSEPIIINQM